MTVVPRERLLHGLLDDLREVQEWFCDDEHGSPLTSDTPVQSSKEDWIGFVGEDGPQFRLSERSYVALCAALDKLDRFDKIGRLD